MLTILSHCIYEDITSRLIFNQSKATTQNIRTEAPLKHLTHRVIHRSCEQMAASPDKPQTQAGSDIAAC